jgi:SET domain-containing protein
MKKELNFPVLGGNDIEVKTSTIKGAGNGLFAMRHFRKNEVITFYDGDLIDWKEAMDLRKDNNSTHVRTIHFGHCAIDGLKLPKSGRGGGSFANDGTKDTLNNSAFKIHFQKEYAKDVVFLKATRAIMIGEEIFLNYGMGYWRNIRRTKQRC